MAMVNQRVQAATRSVVDSCRRVENKADELLAQLEDITPVQGIPLCDLDDEDSAVIAITEVLERKQEASAGPPPKRRARTEPGGY